MSQFDNHSAPRASVGGHTPGPWAAHDKYVSRESTAAGWICEVGPFPIDDADQRAANAQLIAAAPEMVAAAAWASIATKHIEALERELGESLPDTHEIGRIDENADLPSFRIQVGHIRMLAAAIAKATGAANV